MTKSKEEQIFVSVDGEVVELTGKEKDDFIAQQLLRQKELTDFENELKAKQKLREDVIKKLAETAGLTEAELNAIL